MRYTRPGTVPQHTAFLLIDTNRGPEPWAVPGVIATVGRSERDGVSAAALAIDALDRLIEAAGVASAIIEEGAASERRRSAAAIREAAICVAGAAAQGMRRMIGSGAVDGARTGQARGAVHEHPPLEEEWHARSDPYFAVQDVASELRARIEEDARSPSQLYAHLNEAVAVAADVAEWAARARDDG